MPNPHVALWIARQKVDIKRERRRKKKGYKVKFFSTINEDREAERNSLPNDASKSTVEPRDSPSEFDLDSSRGDDDSDSGSSTSEQEVPTSLVSPPDPWRSEVDETKLFQRPVYYSSEADEVVNERGLRAMPEGAQVDSMCMPIAPASGAALGSAPSGGEIGCGFQPIFRAGSPSSPEPAQRAKPGSGGSLSPQRAKPGSGGSSLEFSSLTGLKGEPRLTGFLGRKIRHPQAGRTLTLEHRYVQQQDLAEDAAGERVSGL